MNEKEKQAKDLIVGQVEQALKAMQSNYELLCKNTGYNVVPIDYIQKSTKLFLKSYKKAAYEKA